MMHDCAGSQLLEYKVNLCIQSCPQHRTVNIQSYFQILQQEFAKQAFLLFQTPGISSSIFL